MSTSAVQQTPAEIEPASKEAKKQYRFLDAEPDEKIAKSATLDDTHTFIYEYDSEETGETLRGKFTCQRLDLGKLARMGVRKAQMLGGMSPGSVEALYDSLAEMNSYLEQALVDAPDWWKPQTFREFNLLKNLYEEVIRWETTFRKRGVGERR